MQKKTDLNLPINVICLFWGLMLIFSACKKENQLSENISDLEISNLKKWHRQNFDETSILFSNMIPNWNHVYVNEVKNKTVYEVELINTDQSFVSNGFLSADDKTNYLANSRFKLLFFKDNETGKLSEGYYMTSLSKEVVHYAQVSDFTGYIYFYTKKGNFVNGWSFDGGKAIQSISQGTAEGYKESSLGGLYSNFREKTSISNLSKANLQVTSQEFCYTTSTPIYGTSCIQAGDSPQTYCTTYIKGFTYSRFCTSLPIPTDGNGGIVPDPNNPPGKTPSLPTVPIDDGDITSEFENYPCARALVEQMGTLNSDIAKLIKDTFGVNDITNINFYPDPRLSGTITDGQLNSQSGMTFQIGINPDVLAKSTKEYILVTLYHEALHAYFAQKLATLGRDEFNKQFTGVDVNGGRLISVVNDQHTTMGYDKFVRGLKDAILAFNPRFDPSRATALAELGIIQLNPSEAEINKQERSSSASATGTKCP